MTAYTDAIPALLTGASLESGTASRLMGELLDGALDPAQVAAVLTALATRPPDADELAAFALQMRARALTIEPGGPVIDTCGTGGSGLPTVNTSTLVAFITAAAGARVAKHGNRAASGRCGSMDVLERLGVDIELTPARAESILRAQGIVLMFAPRHHPALGPVGPVRRSLAFRTVFNLLGPLCNPAGATRQLLGVSDASLGTVMVHALRTLGGERAVVVSGHGGLDELSLTGPSRRWDLADGVVTESVIRPEDVGLERAPFEAVAGGEPDENVGHFEAILRGTELGPRADHTALNAGAALEVAGVVADLSEGVDRAREILRNGAAWEKFEAYRSATREMV